MSSEHWLRCRIAEYLLARARALKDRAKALNDRAERLARRAQKIVRPRKDSGDAR